MFLRGVLIMRKLLLVTLLGIVLAMNLYGIINEIISYYETNYVGEINGCTIVHME